MARQRKTGVPVDPADEPHPVAQTDAGAAIAKERCGPPREKYPMTEGQANFATFSQTIINAGQEPE